MWWTIFLLEIVVCGISIFLSYREGDPNKTLTKCGTLRYVAFSVIHRVSNGWTPCGKLVLLRLTIPAYLTLAVLISFFLPFPYIFVGFAVAVCTLYIDKSIL